MFGSSIRFSSFILQIFILRGFFFFAWFIPLGSFPRVRLLVKTVQISFWLTTYFSIWLSKTEACCRHIHAGRPPTLFLPLLCGHLLVVKSGHFSFQLWLCLEAKCAGDQPLKPFLLWFFFNVALAVQASRIDAQLLIVERKFIYNIILHVCLQFIKDETKFAC